MCYIQTKKYIFATFGTNVFLIIKVCAFKRNFIKYFKFLSCAFNFLVPPKTKVENNFSDAQGTQKIGMVQLLVTVNIPAYICFFLSPQSPLCRPCLMLRPINKRLHPCAAGPGIPVQGLASRSTGPLVQGFCGPGISTSPEFFPIKIVTSEKACGIFDFLSGADREFALTYLLTYPYHVNFLVGANTFLLQSRRRTPPKSAPFSKSKIPRAFSDVTIFRDNYKVEPGSDETMDRTWKNQFSKMR